MQTVARGVWCGCLLWLDRGTPGSMPPCGGHACPSASCTSSFGPGCRRTGVYPRHTGSHATCWSPRLPRGRRGPPSPRGGGGDPPPPPCPSGALVARKCSSWQGGCLTSADPGVRGSARGPHIPLSGSTTQGALRLDPAWWAPSGRGVLPPLGTTSTTTRTTTTNRTELLGLDIYHSDGN